LNLRINISRRSYLNWF